VELKALDNAFTGGDVPGSVPEQAESAAAGGAGGASGATGANKYASSRSSSAITQGDDLEKGVVN